MLQNDHMTDFDQIISGTKCNRDKQIEFLMKEGVNNINQKMP